MIFFDGEWGGKTYRFFAQRDKDRLWIHFAGRTWVFRPPAVKSSSLEPVPALKDQTQLVSPLTGRLQSLFVKKGDQVVKGQALLVISAMKMEYSLRAEGPGAVEGVFCSVLQTVQEGQKLIAIQYKK